MARQRPDPADCPIQDAIPTLRRLVGSGRAPVSSPAPAPTSAPLPPRASRLPAWSEPSFRELVEVLPDAVVVIDAAGAIVFVNRQTERLFGYARDELMGEKIEILVPEKFRDGHVGLRDRYLAAPCIRPLGRGIELFGRRKDGGEFPVEISLSPLHGPTGLLVTSVIRDVSDRKRSEAKFRTLVENIPAVTFIAPLDDSNPELYVSPQIEQLLGFTQKEWLEDPVLWHRQLHPEDRENWNLHFAPTCSAGVPFRSTYRFIAKDGRVVWVHGSANVVRDEHGRLLFLQGVAFDVTRIKAAEEERERFFSLSLDLFCIAGLDGYFKNVNRAFTTVLGYTAEELTSRPFLELVHPDDRAETEARMAGLARGEPVERFENRYRCRDGSYRWLQWAAAPFTEGQISYAAARDVTREKQDEEALREQAGLATLRAGVSAALTSADSMAGTLSGCVAALSRGLGASARVWLLDAAQDALVLVAGDADGADVPIPLRDVAAQAAVREVTHGPDAGGGAAFASYPLRMEGALLGVMAVSSGTELSAAALQTLELIAAQVALGIKRKQAEDELLRANVELDRRVRVRTEELSRSLEELKEKEQELEKYAYHATHDIKQPLRNVLVHTQKVTRTYADKLPDEAADRLAKVEAQVYSMQNLLKRLKGYADVNLSAKVEPVDCNEAVAEALSNMETEIQDCADVIVGELPTVPGAKDHLMLLFQNLIGNALKYCSPERPPRVEVGAQPHAEGWLFWVKDNGVGIEPRFWQRIFGIAERLDSKTSGWGYGLAICEKTVTRHGGRIWVASEPGQGSTFYFTLPAGAQG